MPADFLSETRVRALGTALPRACLHPAVLAFAESAPPRTPWGIAFSGGADSLALLLLLWTHWPERRKNFRALHFNHRLRGRAADADEKFCRAVCRALGVKFIAAKWRRPRASTRSRSPASRPSEAEARAARHAFLRQHARVLWLGHQQDDIAESMLMRLARGSGAGGLAAPRPVQRFADGRVHLRPLLTLKKSELAAALRAAKIPWREDASNATGDFFRNRIRRDVLPAWATAAQRDALAGAALARELLEEDEAALETWLARLDALTFPSPRARSGPVLSVTALAGKPRALVRRALHRWLLAQPGAGELSRQAFAALLAAVERGAPTRHSLGRDGFAVLRRGALRFEKAGKPRRTFQRPAN